MEETHPRPERPYLLHGATALVALTFLLPLVGTLEPPRIARIAGYALVFASVVPLLHGFLLAGRSYDTSRLLALGAAAAALGVLLALLARPGNLESGSGVLLSFALSLANLLRILSAASVGVTLARYVGSVGVVLLVVAVATVSDLFSVFVGPTKTLVEGDSPVLDLLLLVFPTFGSTLGFGLAVTAGLLLERPLPALPFIAIAFVLANADLILASLTRRS